MVQGELFRESERIAETSLPKRSALAAYTISISGDKALIGFLVLSVLSILLYCFGVEQGKRSVEKHFESTLPSHGQILGDTQKERAKNPILDTNSTSQDLVVLEAESNSNAVSEENVKLQPEPAQTHSTLSNKLPRDGQYTLQLVTYTNELLAKKEVDHLAKIGHESFVIPSGRFFQVCVNYYPSKSAARFALNGLHIEGRYPGAYIRPVVR